MHLPSLTVFIALLTGLPFVASPGRAADEKPAPAGVAHIKLSGAMDEMPVGESLFGSSNENLKAKLDRIAKAKNDPKIQALYLEIDDLSIGFGKLAELQRAVADFRKSGKKSYAYLNDGATMEY